MAFMSDDAIKKQMAANSSAWFNASPEDQIRLHNENVALANMLGANQSSYNANTGVWHIETPYTPAYTPPAPVYTQPVYTPPAPPVVNVPVYTTPSNPNQFPQIPIPLDIDTSKTPVTKQDANKYVQYGVAAVIILGIISVVRG